MRRFVFTLLIVTLLSAATVLAQAPDQTGSQKSKWTVDDVIMQEQAGGFRISPDGRWLAFDATSPGGSPTVAIAPFRRDPPMQESEWILVSESASHPFWSGDGYRLCYLPTFPNIDIRSRVFARGFDPSTGRVVNEATEVLTLREMIVPAMLHHTAPVVAPDQIVFVLGDFRGDVWIRDV